MIPLSSVKMKTKPNLNNFIPALRTSKNKSNHNPSINGFNHSKSPLFTTVMTEKPKWAREIQKLPKKKPPKSLNKYHPI